MKAKRPSVFQSKAEVAEAMYNYYKDNNIIQENGQTVWEAMAQIVLEAAGIQKLLEDAGRKAE